ncbi:MAG TPA: hypothetical protein VLW85_17450 [Myxococcales bacterium]|nr:hypothetical protein [Myxococcales bacterium]
MQKLLIGMAALALASTGAWAQTSSKDTTSPSSASTDTSKSSSDMTKSSDTAKPSSADTMKSDSSKSGEVSGQLTKLDKSSKSVTISTSSGSQQTLKLASDAKITRDGSTASLDSLKEGDNVRASFDPNSNEAKSIDVTSKSDSSKSK